MKKEIFYIEYDINTIIEIPKGFNSKTSKKKFRILTLFKKDFIDSLRLLRIESKSYYILQSQISIVTVVILLYEENKIGKKNLDLEMSIDRNDIEKYEQ